MAALVIGGLIALSLPPQSPTAAPPSTSPRTIPATEPPPYVAPDVARLEDASLAEETLKQVRSLISKAQEESGTARNNHYKEAAHLCERILMTPGAEAFHPQAQQLKYSAKKGQTLH